MTLGKHSLASLLIVGVLTIPGAACGDDGEATTTSSGRPTPTSSGHSATTTALAHKLSISVLNGKVEGGARRERVKLGELVNIEATSDRDEELHLHGYDITLDLQSGTTTTSSFTADIPGVFEVELERSGRKVMELVVS